MTFPPTVSKRPRHAASPTPVNLQMGFFDLNIPYYESDRHAIDKSSLRGRRLKLALKALELGYTGIAYNRSFKGVMSESDRCTTPLFPLTKLTTSSTSSFVASVKLHRHLLNVAVSSPFRQYTRLTVIVDIPSQLSSLNAANPILRSYDIVAVRPMNQNAFDQACQTSEVDIIAIDFSDKLPFRLKQHMVKAAIKRGVYFEIPYSGLIADAQSRRQMISNCKLLVDWTRGKNIILCSAAPSATELRGPHDAANLFSLLGLSGERAKEAISKNCRSLLANVVRKKHFYKEAVKVEAIPSGEQVNPANSAFNEWLNWDPVSSGEGDILLDDMEKSFSIPKTVKKNVKSINFTSNMNGLPVHGLQIKDLICVSGAALGPADTDNQERAAMESESANDFEDTIEISEEKLKYSNGLEANRSDDLKPNLVTSETKLQEEDAKQDGEGFHITKIDTLSSVALELSNSLTINESTSSAYRLESTKGNQCDTDVCAHKGIGMDVISDKIDIENIRVQSSSQDVYVKGQYSKMTDDSAKLGGGFLIEGFNNVPTDFREPIKDDVRGEQIKIDEDIISKGIGKSLAGRKRRKRNSPHQPFLVPFKHFPKPKHPKRNSQK